MAAAILSALIAVNIAASAGILLVMILRKPVQRMFGARLAYWLWMIPVLAGLATLLPARPADFFPAPAAPIRPIAEATLGMATDWAGRPEQTAPASFVLVNAEPPPAPIDIVPILVAVWAAGAALLIALILLRQHWTVRKFGKLSRDRHGLHAAKGDIGPAVVGVFRPQLVVPADFETRFSERERDLVLAHERAHLSAGHTRINAALALMTCLNWFNPLVHIAARLARTDQELACDAAVVERFPGERRIYAEALLKTQLGPASLPLGCTWPARSPNLLKERVMMLARKSPGRLRRLAGIGIVAAVTLGIGLTAWASRSEEPEEPQQTRRLEAPARAPEQQQDRGLTTLFGDRSVAVAIPEPKLAELVPNRHADIKTLPKLGGAELEFLTGSYNDEVKRAGRQGVAKDDVTSLQNRINETYVRYLGQAKGGGVGSIIPDGYVIENDGAIALAGGGGQSGPTIAYAGEYVTSLNDSTWASFTRYVAEGDTISITKVMVANGQPMLLSGFKVKSGETAIVELPGGHRLKMAPTLRKMTQQERRQYASSGEFAQTEFFTAIAPYPVDRTAQIDRDRAFFVGIPERIERAVPAPEAPATAPARPTFEAPAAAPAPPTFRFVPEAIPAPRGFRIIPGSAPAPAPAIEAPPVPATQAVPAPARLEQTLRIVAVKRADLEVRSADGTKFVARTFEPGESYAPRTGAGWTVSTSDGTAFEWRLNDQPLGLLSYALGPINMFPVDSVLHLAQPAPAPTSGSQPLLGAQRAQPVRYSAQGAKPAPQ